MRQVLTNHEIEKIEDVLLGLECAFRWDQSPQGHEYWEAVANNLLEMLQPPAVVSQKAAGSASKNEVA